MFGTTGYLVAKPGKENDLKIFIETFGRTPGIVSVNFFKINSDKNDYMEFILWTDKNTHDTITSQPDFPATYQELVDLLVEDPVWNSGEVITQQTNVAV